MIIFKNISIGYNNSLITVSELNLRDGELYFLLGRNGSGKSTLFKTITHQIPALQGEILLNRTNIEAIPSKELSRKISFVQPSIQASDYLSVFNYIALGRSPFTNSFGHLKPTDFQAIEDAITKVGIPHLSERFMNELSDGERQLASIAKALTQETPIILLDEPTAFLDYSNKLLIINLLQDIAKQLQKCIVVSSHDVDISLEAKANYLIMNQHTNHLELYDNTLSKEELIKLAY